MLDLLEGVVLHYDWGSATVIPEMLGESVTDRPWAELWLGAHPMAPAVVGASAEPLDKLIAADPAEALGASIAAEFGRLPFLVKILAVARPLSLQAHPSAKQARAGFEREQILGIPVDAPERSFRDCFHKPELVCALSNFEALCGLRDPAATLALLDGIHAEPLEAVRRRLRHDPSPGGLRNLIGWLLSLNREEVVESVDSVVRACSQASDAAPGQMPEPVSAATALFPVISDLGERYPGDAGVIVALLLNHVRLAPGEAMFVAPGSLHCYLHGTAVEVMACSDNVLRGGLTAKHIDIGALLDVMDTAPAQAQVQRLESEGGVTAYRAPVSEFALLRIQVEPSRPVRVAGGPAVLLCTDGCVDIDSLTCGRGVPVRASAGLTLEKGRAIWVDAAEESIRLDGSGTVFHIGPGSSTLVR